MFRVRRNRSERRRASDRAPGDRFDPANHHRDLLTGQFAFPFRRHRTLLDVLKQRTVSGCIAIDNGTGLSAFFDRIQAGQVEFRALGFGPMTTLAFGLQYRLNLAKELVVG